MFRVLLLSAVALVGVAPVATAADLPAEPVIPAHLTLRDAVTIFRTHGLDLLIAEANAEAAAGDVTAANAIPNPNAAAGWYHFFISGNAAGTWNARNGWFVGLGDSNAI